MSLVGTMVGRYRVLRLLGEGGMARVFVAEDTTVGRHVAIKALLPEYSAHATILERFMNEAKAMGRIQHPGVIDVFDVTLAPSGELCIIMELLTGQTLREQLWKSGPFSVPDALPLMHQLADTLAAAHAHRIVHRDRVGVVDFAEGSAVPRFHVVDIAGGAVTTHLVAHGSGSDPDHSGYLQRFSNRPDSNASSRGAFLTGEEYVGKHGRSRRLVGLDPDNHLAESRAIVIHGAAYVSEAMAAAQGRIGRSQGCFAFAEDVIGEILEQLGPGRLIFAWK